MASSPPNLTVPIAQRSQGIAYGTALGAYVVPDVEAQVGASFHWFNRYIDFSTSSPSLNVAMASAAQAGKGIMVSWRPYRTTGTSYATLLAGGYDTVIDGWFAYLSSLQTDIVIRWAWEMNLASDPTSPLYTGTDRAVATDAAQWVAGWKYMVDRARSQGRAFRWFWCPNASDTGGGGTAMSLESFWPGADYVDVVGYDTYNSLDGYWKTPSQTLRGVGAGGGGADAYTRVTALHPSAEVWIGEIGCLDVGDPVDTTGFTTGHSKGAWYREAFAFSGLPRLTTVCWYDTNRQGNWTFNTSDDALAGFRAGIQLAYTARVAPSAEPVTRHEWSMFSRERTYGAGPALPIISAQFVKRHMGIGTAVATTTFTPERWAALDKGCGILLYRDGRQEFTGRLTARQMDWDAESGSAVIKVEAKGDELLFQDRLSHPDPLRTSANQIVNDYWTYAGVASTAMLQLISDQAGPTCYVGRQITGLLLGTEPGIGLNRTWSALFTPVLDQLTLMSVASGANLGLRMTSAAGSLTASITAPRNLVGDIKFSADLSNLVGFSYREEAPTVTYAIANGQGDLHARLRERAFTPTGDTRGAWGREIFAFIDRRDTADSAELIKAAEDAVAEGGQTVSLAVTLTDSQAATYGRDWGLGDMVTVYVGLPGQTKVASVSDVVREIAFEVKSDGSEKITPAIGSYDAAAVIPTPTQQQLSRVGQSLRGLITRT